MVKRMVATETFRANVNGYSDLFTAGETIVDADDPVVGEYPDRFEPYRQDRPDIEQATQAPGEKRGGKKK